MNVRKLQILAVLAGVVLPIGACGLLPPPLGSAPVGAHLSASVSETSQETGLAKKLTGRLSGALSGSYAEEIVDVFFDDDGMPIAALSRSVFTADAPTDGMVISLNLVVVIGPVLATDENGESMLDADGKPIAVGLESAASGQIIHASGVFEGLKGQIRAQSVVEFAGGEFGLGTVESDLMLELDGLFGP